MRVQCTGGDGGRRMVRARCNSDSGGRRMRVSNGAGRRMRARYNSDSGGRLMRVCEGGRRMRGRYNSDSVGRMMRVSDGGGRMVMVSNGRERMAVHRPRDQGPLERGWQSILDRRDQPLPPAPTTTSGPGGANISRPAPAFGGTDNEELHLVERRQQRPGTRAVLASDSDISDTQRSLPVPPAAAASEPGGQASGRQRGRASAARGGSRGLETVEPAQAASGQAPVRNAAALRLASAEARVEADARQAAQQQGGGAAAETAPVAAAGLAAAASTMLPEHTSMPSVVQPVSRPRVVPTHPSAPALPGMILLLLY